MIPVQLILKNFLSYRDATLDFSGLHTACICGANGAGKSSLLEAITWAIWGESRAGVEDDVIHTGAKEVRVDYIFQCNQQKYRVIRTRVRGASGVLEFQIETAGGFRALTGKGVKATQELILQHIKLDYDTFINSAYLRQGRADEFMIKRPSERKEILAELLKLNQYDQLEERAKDTSRQFKGRCEELERCLESSQIQLQEREGIAAQKVELESQLQQLQQVQALEKIQLQSLQVIEHQRQSWEQQLNFFRQQHQNLTQDSDRLQQEQSAIQSQLSDLETILNQEAEIHNGFRDYQSLHSQEEALASKFEEYTSATVLLQQKQQQLTSQIHALEREVQQIEGQLVVLESQEPEIEEILQKSREVEAALGQLNIARRRLTQLDELQMQVFPLLQQRQNLQNQVDKVHNSILARLEQLQSRENQLKSSSQRQQQLEQAARELEAQISQMEKDKVYLQRVREKGLERRHFMERLQGQEREYERLLGELEKKLQMLRTPDASCPLCESPLDEHHWNRVLDKTKEEYKAIEDQLWVLREQKAVSDREIQVLRQEYREIDHKLSNYDNLREQRGQLAAQLQSISDNQQELQQLATQKQDLERSLELGDYAPDKQGELRQLEEYLQQLNYNEPDHALARSEVERWRWAEIKQGQIRDALKRKGQIADKKPELQGNIAELQTKIQQEQTDSECAQQIAQIQVRIGEIGYSSEHHNSLRQAVRQAQSWQLRYQQLLLAQEQYPQLQQRWEDLEASRRERWGDVEKLLTEIASMTQQLEQSANPREQIKALEGQIHTRRQQLDDYISHLGRLEQMMLQLEDLQTQYEAQQQELQACKQQQRVYQELAQAFGKNGIQALMIENVLPQLEAETNQLLSRLSANQLHVQFITQKSGRSNKAKKKNAKLIDTLDILIADARGTRAYETYSGGEAFRINFAIRLALAKLLAQRAGAALQLLIIDEGFGTQDAEGCDRLIASINAIASDFACILTVTHMPHLKEAFQARIEVNKSQEGSQVSLSI